MASYRYERDIDPKDLTPRKKRAYTRKERWANWWDYNLKWVIILGIAAAFVGYCFIGQYFLTTHARLQCGRGGPPLPAGGHRRPPCRTPLPPTAKIGTATARWWSS